MLIKAREKETGCTFLVGDASELPFEAASMDVVIACMAYHHFPNQKKFREEARRVLKPGGRLYICDPRLPAPVRGFLNTFFKEAGFYNTKQNVNDFLAMGFAEEKIVRDVYVQVLCFRKEQM
jgi:ubiquinone/menaquinone biosynthesis C-methylase UbiE